MNSKQVTGITVVSIEGGQKLGSVGDVYLDANARMVLGYTVTAGGGMLSTESKATYWLPAKRVSAVGPDAMTVQQSEAMTQSPPPAEAIVLSEVLKRKVVTEGGTLVGQIASLEFDAQGMSVVGVEVSAGVFSSNTTIQPAEIVSVGEELIIVRDSVLSGEATQRPEDAPSEYRFLSGDVKAADAKTTLVDDRVDDRSGGVEPNDVDPTASRAKRT